MAVQVEQRRHLRNLPERCAPKKKRSSRVGTKRIPFTLGAVMAPVSSIDVVGALVEHTTAETSSDGSARIARESGARRFVAAVHEALRETDTVDVRNLHVHGSARTQGPTAFDQRVHMRHGCVVHEHVRLPGVISAHAPRGVARPGHIVLCGSRLYVGLADGRWGFVPLRVDAACADSDSAAVVGEGTDGDRGDRNECGNHDDDDDDCDNHDDDDCYGDAGRVGRVDCESCDDNAADSGSDDSERAPGAIDPVCTDRERCAPSSVLSYHPSWDDEDSEVCRRELSCGTLVRRDGQLYRTLRSMARWEFAALSLCASRNNGLELI